MALHPFAARILGSLPLGVALSLATACGGIAVLDPGSTGGGGGAGGSTGGAGGAGGTTTCGLPPPPGDTAPFSGICVQGCPEPSQVKIDPTSPELVLTEDCLSACECNVTDVVAQCVVAESQNGCCYAGYFTYEVFQCGGRPFEVDGEARVAPMALRSDWLAEPLAPEPSVALAASWAEDAAFEHASVASFAAHVLDLLAVGAPADLVRDAQRALGDEIEHARLCYALASRAGAPVGPGPLAVEGRRGRATLAEVAAATVREGCVNETLAALVAARELAVTADADARRALERIAEDEARHAELAWRVVAWALATGGPEVREAVTAAFREVRVPAASSAACAPGRLSANKRAGAVAEALREVIGPCARALLAAEAQVFGADGAGASA